MWSKEPCLMKTRLRWFDHVKYKKNDGTGGGR